MKSHRNNIAVLLLAACCASATAANDPLATAVGAGIENNRQEAKTQGRIDGIDDQTRAMLEEYQRLSRELDVLQAYNGQLERLVQSQQAEQSSIHGQMTELEATQREIVPLMLRMVEELRGFLAVDHPFLAEERRLRLEQLQALMDRADVSIGEKYRRVLEAYQIEMEYGRTIEAYRGELQGDGASRTVDFLRVGRVGLYYQTLDREEVGHWDMQAGGWRALSDDYTRTIRDGLRIARKQAAPDLLHLPLPAPVTASSQEAQP